MGYSDSNFFDKNSNPLERSGLLSNIAASKQIIEDGQSLQNRPFLDEVIEQCLHNLRYKSALFVIKGLLEVFPHDASLWHKKSLCYQNLHSYRKAFLAFRKTIHIDPVNIDFQLDFAAFYLLVKQNDKAVAIFKKLQYRFPTDFELDLKIGEIYLNQKEYNTALVYFEKLVEALPNSADGLFNLALCFEYLGNYQTALEFYDKYLFIESNCAIGWYNRGIVLENLKKHFDAIESYRFSITLDDTFPDALFNLGNLYADIDDYNQAIDCFKKVITLDSENSGAYYNLGVLYEDLQDHSQAIYFYSKAVQYKISFQDAYLGRGNCYSKSDNLHAALEDFRSALIYNDSANPSWQIPKKYAISIDESCLQKIRSYELKGIDNLSQDEFFGIIENYLEVGKYSESVSLISQRSGNNLTPDDIFMLAKIHFIRNNSFLGYLYLNKSFYIKSELIQIFAKMFPKVSSSRLFSELFGFKK